MGDFWLLHVVMDYMTDLGIDWEVSEFIKK